MNNLEYYIGNIPEIYQRIYNHPEYDSEASRNCEDREKAITEIVRAYQLETGKDSMKVLDIGCAQGYYCFKLDEIGCEVVGIDLEKSNIELCHFLNSENNSSIVFMHESLSVEYAEKIIQFDIIIVLNVMHHISHLHGFEYAKKIMDILANKAQIVIIELALKSEPLYWNESLPVDYREFLNDYDFYKVVNFFPTHLQTIRPLCFCSNSYVICDGRLFIFTERILKPFAHGLEFYYKRIYLNDNTLIKYAYNLEISKVSEFALRELENEIKIIQEYHLVIDFSPEILALERNDNHILVVLKIERGELLYEMIVNKKSVNKDDIILDILENLILLEDMGLYHNDIRLWNVVLDSKQKAFLIDFGAITKDYLIDCHSNFFGVNYLSVHESLLIMIYDLITGNTYPSLTQTGFYILQKRFASPSLPEPYKTFFKTVAVVDLKEISYSMIKDQFILTVIEKDKALDRNTEIMALYSMVDRIQADHYALLSAVNIDRQNFGQQIESLNQALHHWHAVTENLSAELHSVYRSKSWLITMPLRKMSQAFKKLLRYLNLIKA